MLKKRASILHKLEFSPQDEYKIHLQDECRILLCEEFKTLQSETHIKTLLDRVLHLESLDHPHRDYNGIKQEIYLDLLNEVHFSHE